VKLKIFLFNVIFFSCSTLGLGDFENENSPLTNEAYINSGLDMIKVEFIYQPLIGGKHEVFLTGDFNNWSESSIKMDDSDGIYTKTMYLKKGKYSYKYIVDGQWVVDENADDFIDDGDGGKNSVVYVGNKKDIDALRKVEFVYKPDHIVKEVYLVGTMNDWNLKATRMFES